MNDYGDAETLIGGKVPRSKIPGLIEAINIESCPENLGDPEEDLETATKNLLSLIRTEENTGCLDIVGKIWLWVEDTYHGEMWTIQNHCEKNDIGYLIDCPMGFLYPDKNLPLGPFEIVED